MNDALTVALTIAALIAGITGVWEILKAIIDGIVERIENRRHEAWKRKNNRGWGG
jgi:hypothetical protein